MAGASYRLAVDMFDSQCVYTLKKQVHKWVDVLQVGNQCKDAVEAVRIVLRALGTVWPPINAEFEVGSFKTSRKVKVYLAPYTAEDKEAVQAREPNSDVTLAILSTRTMWHVQKHFFNKWGLPIIMLKPDGEPLSPNEVVAAVVANLATGEDKPGTVQVDYRVLQLNPSTVLSLTTPLDLTLPPAPPQEPVLPPQEPPLLPQEPVLSPQEIPLPPPLPPRRKLTTGANEENESNKRKRRESSKDGRRRKRTKKCGSAKDVSRRDANRARMPMPPPPPPQPPSLPASDELLPTVTTPSNTRRVLAQKSDEASGSGSAVIAKLQARLDSLGPEMGVLDPFHNSPPGVVHPGPSALSRADPGPSVLSRGDSLAMHANPFDFETKESSRDLCDAFGDPGLYDITHMFRHTSKGPMHDGPATSDVLRFAAIGSAPNMNSLRGKQHNPVEPDALRVDTHTPAPAVNDTTSKDAAATNLCSNLMKSVSESPPQSKDDKVMADAPEDARFSLPPMSSDITQQTERAIKSSEEGAAPSFLFQ